MRGATMLTLSPPRFFLPVPSHQMARLERALSTSAAAEPVVSPFLNTVRAILRDARMREQTAVIQAEIIKLIEDVVRLDKRVDQLGRHFGQAQKDVDDIRTSTGKITRRGERIGEFDVIEDAASGPDLLS